MGRISDDVTDLVKFGDNDGEFLPLEKCICGKVFDSWDFILKIYPDMAKKCICGRKYYFQNKITIFEVTDEWGEHKK
jgi:hypothetical protein